MSSIDTTGFPFDASGSPQVILESISYPSMPEERYPLTPPVSRPVDSSLGPPLSTPVPKERIDGKINFGSLYGNRRGWPIKEFLQYPNIIPQLRKVDQWARSSRGKLADSYGLLEIETHFGIRKKSRYLIPDDQEELFQSIGHSNFKSLKFQRSPSSYILGEVDHPSIYRSSSTKWDTSEPRPIKEDTLK